MPVEPIMHSYPYNPFQKELTEVVGEDLAVLRHVSEGWYIDYKSQGLEIRELAKHMSAFANQYGGWLLFGISESKDGTRVAESFPGIAKADVPVLSLRLREAISAHLSPSVLYEEHVIYGPCDAIGLCQNQAILIVGIPQGVDPPHIHSSGRIFRRLADQSFPKAETDRHTLDLLWERGKAYRSKVSERFRRTPELREEQKNSTWAFIFLSPDLRLPSPEPLLPFKAFRNLVTSTDTSLGISMPLQEVRSADFGFLGRQVEGNNPQFGTVALRWWHGGIARLDIPINTWSVEEFRQRPRAYRNTGAFLTELVNQGHQDAQICDFSLLIYIAVALTNMHRNIQKAAGDDRRVYAACELRNLFYKTPFFNSSRYVERCRTDRVPIITERTIVCPERPFFDNMFEVSDKHLTEQAEESGSSITDVGKPFIRMAGLLHWILNTVGIVSDVDEMIGYSELWENHSAPVSRI
jgi:hypothetical protein